MNTTKRSGGADDLETHGRESDDVTIVVRGEREDTYYVDDRIHDHDYDYDEDYDDSTLIERLAESARDNPVPAALIGASVAWMLFARRPVSGLVGDVSGARPIRRVGRALSDASGAASRAASEAGRTVGRAAEDVAGRVGEAGRMVADRAEQLGDRTARGAARAKEAVGHTGERVADAVGAGEERAERELGRGARAARQGADRAGRSLDATGRTVRDTGRQARGVASDLSRRGARLGLEHPLATAALGLAAGAGLAMLIPRSRAEEEVIGAKRDEMLRGVQRRTAELVSQGVDAARDQAARSVEPAAERAAKKAADEVLHRADAVGDAVKDAVGAPGGDGTPRKSGGK
ncbi:hypothetical protein [Jannaschia formosa]|uniref:hypothetical protein n=1 Tax=Jannaschia formosa TaxID=2259592 RepID=UPI000E1B7795|nr:hypothetical protein [Jannaschia formosa]TFL15964.1 hypothetical protein DR046_22565 [Jannaschia formosa]